MDKWGGQKKSQRKKKEKGDCRAFSYIISQIEKQNFKKYALFAKWAFFSFVQSLPEGGSGIEWPIISTSRNTPARKQKYFLPLPSVSKAFSWPYSLIILWFWLEQLEITMFYFFWNMCVFDQNVSNWDTTKFPSCGVFGVCRPIVPQKVSGVCSLLPMDQQWGRPSFTGEIKAR